MAAVTNDRRTHNPCYYIGSLGRWIGRKITTEPQKIHVIANFIRGAACFPIVWLGNKVLKPLIVTDMRKTIADMACSKEMLAEVATFSLPRRIVAPITLAIFTSIITPIVEEAICRKGFQDIVLKRMGIACLQKLRPNAVEFWNSKWGKCVRETISTSAFVMVHLVSSSTHAFLVIPLGLAASVLQEEYDTTTAIGLHITSNIIGNIELFPFMFRCYFSS